MEAWSGARGAKMMRLTKPPISNMGTTGVIIISARKTACTEAIRDPWYQPRFL
jgi:hypothetical protein